MPGPAYVLHVAARGNVFMREIAELMVAALTDLGREAEVRRDGLPIAEPGQIDIVVAPHELFELTEASPEQRRATSRRVVCLGTEQPGTPWFELSAAWAAAGPVALDINPLAVRALRRRGVDAHLVRLGYHESIDCWHGSSTERSTDVLFMGAETPRRGALLSSFGETLSRRECDLRLFAFDSPASVSTPQFLTGAVKLERLATSKVLLNIHRSEVPYFEWMRAIEAIANGCVLVTEPADDLAPLVPMQHLVTVPGARLIDEVEELLDDEDRRALMAVEAHDVIRRELHLTKLLERELPAIEQAALRRPGIRVPDVRFVTRLASRRAARTTKALAVRGKDGLLRRGRHLLLPPGDAVDPVEMAHRLKVATLANRQVERRLEALEAEHRFGDPAHVEVRTTSSFDAFEPQVTVVIPLFDYEREVVVAIESVMASEGVAAELLVVDDHSRDGSRAAAEQCLAENDDFPMAVLAKAANAGLSAARNTGFERARADRVFVLDADNAVYPNGLARLSQALDADPAAAFAYGIIERYGDGRSLISALPWDPAQLTRGNYIDAMALVRVDAWRRAGGYDPDIDGRFGGWEDYELWLHLAALGLHGTHVRQVVAKYHSHTGSMLSLLNLETATVRHELQQRYPDLPWPTEPVS